MLSIMCALAWVPQHASAQSPEAAMLMSKAAVPPRETMMMAGPFLEGGFPIARGELTLACCAQTGSPTGYAAGGGAAAMWTLGPRWGISARLGWYRTSDTYQQTAEGVTKDVSGQNVTYQAEHKTVVTMSAVHGGVAARWTPGVGALHVDAGPDAWYIHANHARETGHMLTPDLVFAETHTTDVVKYDGEIGDVVEFQKLQLGLRASIGYDLAVSTDLTLVPELGILFPLTSVTPQTGWKLGAYTLSIAAMMRM